MMWKKLLGFFVPCMSLHVHELPLTQHIHTLQLSFSFIPRNEGSLLQPDLSIYPSNRWTFNPSVALFFFVCLFVAIECGVSVRNGRWRGARGLLLPGFWVCSCESCPPNCVCLRVCMCVHCLAGGIYVVLFVLKVFPHSDPRGGSRTRETERERKRERECLCCPLTAHTLIILS